MRATSRFKKSLVQGVSFSQTESKWLARHQGWYIGRFNTKAEAEAAVLGFTKVFSNLANYFAVTNQLQEAA
jgi:hypothetical protein